MLPSATERSKDMSGLEGLSQVDTDNLSQFRTQVNVMRASNGQRSIAMDDAMRYLKASHFNASRAIEMYKNYEKHREVYDLDNLRPHRDPLSSEIGSKKLQLLSTHDKEGSSVLVFTGHLHSSVSRGNKAFMQLLFYTLDLLSDRTDSDNGSVLIMDMRDCPVPSYDARFLNQMIAVLVDGYPIMLKAVYIVNAAIWFKSTIGAKARKLHDGVKFVTLEELATYFTPDQLPSSLGGNHIPGGKGLTRSSSARSSTTSSALLHAAKSSSPPARSKFAHVPRDEGGSVAQESNAGINNLLQLFGGRSKSSAGVEGNHGSKPLPPPPQLSAQHDAKRLPATGGQPSAKPLPPPLHKAPPLKPPSHNPPSLNPPSLVSHAKRPPPRQMASKDRPSEAFRRPLIPVPPVLNPSVHEGSGGGAQNVTPSSLSKPALFPSPSHTHQISDPSNTPKVKVPRGGAMASRIQNFETSSDAGKSAAPSVGRLSDSPFLKAARGTKSEPLSSSSSTPSSSSSITPTSRVIPPSPSSSSSSSSAAAAFKLKKASCNTHTPSPPSHAPPRANHAPLLPSHAPIPPSHVPSKSPALLAESRQPLPQKSPSPPGSKPITFRAQPTPVPKKAAHPPPPPQRVQSIDDDDCYEEVAFVEPSELPLASGVKAPIKYENVPRRWSAGKAMKREEEEKRLAAKKEEEDKRLAARKKKEEEDKRLAEMKKREEEEEKRLAAARRKREEEEKRLAAKREEEDKRLTEMKKREEEEKRLVAARRKREDEDKRLAARKKKEEEDKRLAAQEEKKLAAKKPSGATPTKSKPLLPAYENVVVKSKPVAFSMDEGSSSSDEGGACLSEEEGVSLAPEESIYENFGPDDGNCAMAADELQKHVSSKGKKGLEAEYLRIKNEPFASTYQASKMICNKSKNRYKDVVCYDSTRVSLQLVAGIEGSDYIHANYVSGYHKPEAFILTQGPLKKTVVDFWRLLWEKEVFVVVMTTKCVELGKLKCAQYWPDKDSATYGNVTVSVTTTERFPGYDLRTLKAQSKDVERTIKHYQFLAWPDYGVPDSGTTILPLIHAVRDMQRQHDKFNKPPAPRHFPPHGPPIVVHCSAGVGRSGTFCTVDSCIDELQDMGKVNVQGTVRRLRCQRAFAIQTDQQYVFCYKTMVEYARTELSSAKRS